MKEAPFVAYVIDVARRFGWRYWHVPAPMRYVRGEPIPAKEAAGLCDLVLLHEDPPLLILAECKGDGGKITPEQQEFLRLAQQVAQASAEVFDAGRNVLRKAGVDVPVVRPIGVYVWAPGDEDALEAILRSKVLM